MYKDIYIVPAIFDYADDGISIEFPDLPGCLSCANTDEEALYMAQDVLKGFLVCMEEENEEIPKPTPLKDIKEEENQRAVLIEVCVASLREKNKNKFVKKTLSIPYYLNVEAERAGINFSQALQVALKEKLNIN